MLTVLSPSAPPHQQDAGPEGKGPTTDFGPSQKRVRYDGILKPYYKPWSTPDVVDCRSILRVLRAVVRSKEDGVVVSDGALVENCSLWTFVLKLLSLSCLGKHKPSEKETWKTLQTFVTREERRDPALLR